LVLGFDQNQVIRLLVADMKHVIDFERVTFFRSDERRREQLYTAQNAVWQKGFQHPVDVGFVFMPTVSHLGVCAYPSSNPADDIVRLVEAACGGGV
jgi:hypothetical protein